MAFEFVQESVVDLDNITWPDLQPARTHKCENPLDLTEIVNKAYTLFRTQPVQPACRTILGQTQGNLVIQYSYVLGFDLGPVLGQSEADKERSSIFIGMPFCFRPISHALGFTRLRPE